MKITELIQGDLAVSTEDGDLVYEQIVKAIDEQVVIKLDFADLDLITTAFLNNAIGKLYAKYDAKTLNKYLQLNNITEADISLLMQVIERASEKFEGTSFRETLDEELGDVE